MENPRPSSSVEPEPKKLKMSTTTTDEDDDDVFRNTEVTADGSVSERKQRYKRRKIAIFFAYCGVGYQGMQKNPGAKTIEGDLEEALFSAGAVPEQDRGMPKRYDWARSARTDKGVSAVGQVVSGRFYIDPPGLIDRLNSLLPSQFQIFGFKRVTGSFNAKKFCDRRRYVYLVPVFALDPSCHRDRESVKASLGSGNELVKCLECSDRGRKVIGLMGKRTFELSGNISTETEGISLDTGAAGQEIEGFVEKEHINENGNNSDAFVYGEREKEMFNRVLKRYEGTHNFHNFTTRIKAEDPAAKRYIISFEANTTVNVEGIEFVKCEVVGQSFMLHQIRKMVGLAVAIMRGCAPESLIETAFNPKLSITVPTAPEVGLYLDECFFSSYNKKWKDTHEEVSMTSYAEVAQDFKMKHIYPHIALTEDKEGVVALWLHSLNRRNYPDLYASDYVRNGDDPKHVETAAADVEESTAVVEAAAADVETAAAVVEESTAVVEAVAG
ncbi:tRNA pseudouridine synthase A [Impatiens glandulifera]|uniref:tRNA pseudouridine synthase A n=1 Tax=Impatiens glandulifera TaxID=253017 RepID=UPI001FB18C78|nr:tRNA pseudouridine synthase A [Impatiens glandulifera]